MKLNHVAATVVLAGTLSACDAPNNLSSAREDAADHRAASAAERDQHAVPASDTASRNMLAKNGVRQAPDTQVVVADDLDAFAQGNAKVLTSLTGDLKGDGSYGGLLVLGQPSKEDAKLGEGQPRTVLLAVRDANGQWGKIAQNDKIVPCERCGGLSGDPFGYARITEPGAFMVLTEGGSRERWWSEYTFKYSKEQQAWLVDRVKRGVADTEGDGEKEIDLVPKDFGTIRFEDFDPSTLPDVVLP